MPPTIGHDDDAGKRRGSRRGRRGGEVANARSAVALSTTATSSQRSSAMDGEDGDATPRVLRVINPSLSTENDRESSQGTCGSRRKFSFRSISNSLSSILGSRSTSRSHLDSSQDLPPGCGSLSTLFAAHQPFSLTLKKRFLPDKGDRVCSTPSDSLISSRPSTLLSTHHPPQFQQQQRFPIDGEDQLSAPRSLFSISAVPSTRSWSQATVHKHRLVDIDDLALHASFPNLSSPHIPDQYQRLSSEEIVTPRPRSSLLQKRSKRTRQVKSQQKTGIFRRVLSTIMSPPGVLTNGVRYEDEILPPTTTISAPPVRRPTLDDMIFTGSLANGAFANAPLRNMNMTNGNHGNSMEHPSTRSSRMTPASRETEATSFDSAYLRAANPHPFHPTPSRNPLIVPPPSPVGSRTSHHTRESAQRVIAVPRTRLAVGFMPAVAALCVEASTFTVFGQHPKYGATAHVIFDVTARKQNTIVDGDRPIYPPAPPGPFLMGENYPGHLVDLQIDTFISGPGVKLAEIGLPAISTLHVDDRWLTIVHIGIKENSLASRLSTSVRGSTSQDKSSSLSLIDQWLHVLKRENKKESEPIVVSAIIQYGHAFLPGDGVLENRASCSIHMYAENDREAAREAARQGRTPHQDTSTLVSDFTSSTDDLFRHAGVASSIIHALDPGRNTVKLQSVNRLNRELHPNVRGSDALRLIEDFRNAFGFAAEQWVTFDLAALEAHYRQVHAREVVHLEPPPTLGSSIRRRAKTVVNKLSPQRRVKKPAVSATEPGYEGPVTPPNGETRGRETGHVNEPGDVFANIIEGYAGRTGVVM